MSAVVRSVPLPAASAAVTTRPSSYYGFSVYNTSTNNPATVILYDGTDATGALLDTITLAASGSARESYPNAVTLNVGVYAAITGTVAGVLRIG